MPSRRACWWWAKHQLKFVHHSALILVWLNERDQLQLLIEPSVLVRMRQMRGDCAIYTMLICAFLDCFHVPWEIVTLAVNPSQPTIFGHVFPRVVLPDGRRVALDASHGKYPGWQVPRNHTFRSQAWDQDGEPIPDTPTFEGLHDYVPTPAGMWRSGLGQDDSIPTLPVDTSSTSGYEALYSGLPVTVDTSSSIDLSSYLSSIDPSGNPIVTPITYQGVTVPAGSVVVPSQSSANYANAATALAKMGLSLAQINAMQPGMVVNPNGQIIYQNPGYPVSSGASISAAIGSNSILLYGGLALLAVLLMGSLRK